MTLTDILRTHLSLFLALSGSLALGCAGTAEPAKTPVEVVTAAPSASAVPVASEAKATPVAHDPTHGEPIVEFGSPEGMIRLGRAEAKVDFFTLSNHFESQQNLAMCGPTSAVIVLNALRHARPDETKPSDPTLFPQEFAVGVPPGLKLVFNRYSQGIFLDDERVSRVKSRATFFGKPDANGKRDPGIQLRQLDQVLLNFGLRTTLRVVENEPDVAAIREELLRNLAQPGDYVIINYHRPALAQPGGGHMSPLGAYDEASDSFLILDVNPNRKPWVWVKAEKLVAAMATLDITENRGYLLVRDVP
jgi:hypothetical protein